MLDNSLWLEAEHGGRQAGSSCNSWFMVYWVEAEADLAGFEIRSSGPSGRRHATAVFIYVWRRIDCWCFFAINQLSQHVNGILFYL